VPDRATGPVGSVVLWRSEWEGSQISEAGWMILPEHQGRGHAGAAVREPLTRARAEGRWGEIHAFPSTTNVPSNANCRRAGFEPVGEADVDYGGRMLHCNHWIWRA